MKRLILLIILAFVISCNGTPTSTQDNWRTGTQGVIMSFVQDNPSNELLSTQKLSVMVEYANRGAYDINNLKFYLTGYDPTIFQLGGAVKEFTAPALPGKDQFNPEGSQLDYFSWEANINAPRDVDSFKQDLTVTACYHYETLAAPSICIDPKKYDYVMSSRCKFDTEGLGGSQGGPVAVTGIRQKTTDNKVYLEITFQNKGSGIPYAPNLPVNNCYNNLQLKDVDTLRVKEVSVSGKQFTCQPTGTLRLDGGEGFVICSLPISGESYYVSPLKIVLEYNYRQSMSKTVSITNI